MTRRKLPKESCDGRPSEMLCYALLSPTRAACETLAAGKSAYYGMVCSRRLAAQEMAQIPAGWNPGECNPSSTYPVLLPQASRVRRGMVACWRGSGQSMRVD